jgi:hypothetical protein
MRKATIYIAGSSVCDPRREGTEITEVHNTETRRHGDIRMIRGRLGVRRAALCAGGGHTVGRDKRLMSWQPLVSADRVTTTTPAERPAPVGPLPLNAANYPDPSATPCLRVVLFP